MAMQAAHLLEALGANMAMGGESAHTSNMSNTISITDHSEEAVGITSKIVKQLCDYGEIARLDTSLATVLKCILVTYFDVRDTQKAMLDFAGRCEPFPAADHDFRLVIVSMAAYAAKVGVGGGFTQYGEVANISMHQGDALVEFYDMRAAQRLCAVAGSSASPCVPRANPNLAWARPGDFGGFGCGGLFGGGMFGGMLGMGLGAEAMVPPFGITEGASDESLAAMVKPVSKAAAAASEDAPASEAKSGRPVALSGALPYGQGYDQASGPGSPTANRPLRTKISNKDFSKFDISPEKIRSGEDQRTTVMVRNLVGPRARKDFLKFLEKGGLHDKFTFFYMPCKEHRDVRAGFAFVNFRTADEVVKLWDLVQGRMWMDMRVGDPQCKPLAMSYARFQGHDELMSHFSTSVVMHEQDPEKRPIFCNDAGSSAWPRQSAGGSLGGGGGGDRRASGGSAAGASKRGGGAGAGGAGAAVGGGGSAGAPKEKPSPGIPLKLKVPSDAGAQRPGSKESPTTESADKELQATLASGIRDLTAMLAGSTAPGLGLDASAATAAAATAASAKDADGPVYLPPPLTWGPRLGSGALGEASFGSKGDVAADGFVHPASIGA